MGNAWKSPLATRSSWTIVSRFTKRCAAGSNPRLPRKNFRNFLHAQEITLSGLADSPAQKSQSSVSAPGVRRRSFFSDASRRQIRPAAHRDHYGWEWSLGQSARLAPDQGSRERSAGRTRMCGGLRRAKGGLPDSLCFFGGKLAASKKRGFRADAFAREISQGENARADREECSP